MNFIVGLRAHNLFTVLLYANVKFIRRFDELLIIYIYINVVLDATRVYVDFKD